MEELIKDYERIINNLLIEFEKNDSKLLKNLISGEFLGLSEKGQIYGFSNTGTKGKPFDLRYFSLEKIKEYEKIQDKDRFYFFSNSMRIILEESPEFYRTRIGETAYKNIYQFMDWKTYWLRRIVEKVNPEFIVRVEKEIKDLLGYNKSKIVSLADNQAEERIQIPTPIYSKIYEILNGLIIAPGGGLIGYIFLKKETLYTIAVYSGLSKKKIVKPLSGILENLTVPEINYILWGVRLGYFDRGLPEKTIRRISSRFNSVWDIYKKEMEET